MGYIYYLVSTTTDMDPRREKIWKKWSGGSRREQWSVAITFLMVVLLHLQCTVVLRSVPKLMRLYPPAICVYFKFWDACSNFTQHNTNLSCLGMSALSPHSKKALWLLSACSPVSV